jgi:hypothetical protein
MNITINDFKLIKKTSIKHNVQLPTKMSTQNREIHYEFFAQPNNHHWRVKFLEGEQYQKYIFFPSEEKNND